MPKSEGPATAYGEYARAAEQGTDENSSTYGKSTKKHEEPYIKPLRLVKKTTGSLWVRRSRETLGAKDT